MPKISIIVPVYKVERFLNRCVDSIIKQTLCDFDLILVDDGSPDNCGKICDSFAGQDARIHVIHQDNCGLSAARNAGIEWAFSNSDSQWLTFIDSDDWVHPQYLELMFHAVQQCETMISICAYQETTAESQVENEELSLLTFSPEELYCQKRVNATVSWGKLYHKSCFENLRFPEGKIHEDEFVTYKIIFAFSQVAYLYNQLYFYYYNPDGIMHTKWSEKRLDVLEAYKNQRSFFESNKYERALFCSVRSAVGVLHDTILILPPEQKKLKKNLRNELRQLVKQYKQYVPFRECHWVYVVAYPIFIKTYDFVYRVICGIWRRIRG